MFSGSHPHRYIKLQVRVIKLDFKRRAGVMFGFIQMWNVYHNLTAFFLPCRKFEQ